MFLSLLVAIFVISYFIFYNPASQASRELENLTERKNLHTLGYGVKEFICLSLFDPFSTYLHRLAPFTGGMKFATQISLIIKYVLFLTTEAIQYRYIFD